MQFTFAPQLMFEFAASVQSPLQVPEHEPPQWMAALPGMAVHFASHVPLHVPAHAALFTWLVPPLAAHEPVQLPLHVPAH